MSLPRLSKNGFTLVELAIVLVIVGILVAMGAAMIGPLSNMARIRETKDTLEADSQAITSWASANNRLPDTTSGAASPTFFNNVAKTPNDAWGRPVVYLYDATNLAPGVATKDTICGRRTTFLNISTHNPDAYIQNAAYAVASSGINMAFGSTLTGGSSGIITDTNVSAATTIHQDRAANDILRWVTLDELRSKAGCQGAPLKIVNNELPFGSLPNPYPDTVIAADGGTGSANYTWCIQNSTGTAPAGLNFRQNTNTGAPMTIFSQNCSGFTPWGAATQIVVNGQPTVGGSNLFTVFVQDSNSNTASKPFVLTINPN